MLYGLRGSSVGRAPEVSSSSPLDCVLVIAFLPITSHHCASQGLLPHKLQVPHPCLRVWFGGDPSSDT